MQQFILYFRGRDKAPAADRTILHRLPGVRILDEVPGRLALVEGDETVIRDAISSLPGWSAHPEITYAPPDNNISRGNPPKRRLPV